MRGREGGGALENVITTQAILPERRSRDFSEEGLDYTPSQAIITFSVATSIDDTREMWSNMSTMYPALCDGRFSHVMFNLVAGRPHTYIMETTGEGADGSGRARNRPRFSGDIQRLILRSDGTLGLTLLNTNFWLLGGLAGNDRPTA
ncbi:hypothetical protein KC366_g2 [Hortaea werneckii]|nr:hypothetical protein KC366_g2 [Hortaea werneckii]